MNLSGQCGRKIFGQGLGSQPAGKPAGFFSERLAVGWDRLPCIQVRGQSPQRRLVDDPWEASTLQQGVPGCEYAATVLIADWIIK